MNTSPVRVGIIGLGRSGWSIHALGLQQMPEHYQIVAVADLITERRAEAQQTFGCRAYAGYGELLADQEVELVIVAPPSYLHAVYTIAALQAGKAVVCEKPMAENLADADGMLAAARRTGSLFTMFQNRRYEASYLKVREIIASGVLGRIFQIKLTVHSFSRRWDWQTLRAFAGGQLRNNGVHYLDQSLQLMDLASGGGVPGRAGRLLPRGECAGVGRRRRQLQDPAHRTRRATGGFGAGQRVRLCPGAVAGDGHAGHPGGQLRCAALEVLPAGGAVAAPVGHPIHPRSQLQPG